MKTTFGIYLVIVFSLNSGDLLYGAPTGASQKDAAVPPPTAYSVVGRDANSRVWERTTYELSPSGSVVPQKHRYTELATGLHYQKNGQWVESKEEIDILPNGTAAATQGQHQARFPGDIYEGVIELVTPDGVHLQSRPLGLSYDDGTNTVLIAELKDSVGQLVGSNQVIYPDAFTDFKADLRYTYTKAGFEQDIILREQPLTPESYGLNPATARLQVLSEFFDPPQPAVITARLPKQAGIALSNENLDFGAMKMMPGRAFLLGSDAHEGGAWVSKSWVKLEGRQFLVEEVPVEALVNELVQLPAPQTASAKPNVNSLLHVVSAKRLLPASRLTKISPSGQFKQVAQATTSTPGLVLDYVTMTTQTNYTFQGDTTYYLSGSLNLWYTNTFEGGAVIKYTNGASIYLVPVSSSLIWRASAYRPVVFTAMDDNSVGENISGSSGNPTNYYANPALQLVGLSTIPTISNFRIAYARQAVSFAGNPCNLYNGQIVNCLNGITVGGANTINVRNVLFGNVQTNFNNLLEGNFNVQNSTFSGSSYLSTIQNQPYQSSSVTMINCLLVNVTNLQNSYAYTNEGSYQVNGSYNGFYNSPSVGTATFTNTFYPFQSVGAGNYYLASGCNFTNAGTTNIDLILLAGLEQRTTHPPMVYSNKAIYTNITLAPQAQRDTNSRPDLGYHYDPLDYVVSQTTLYNRLILTNGVAVGLFGSYGFNLIGQAFSTGTPQNLNRLAAYSMVQEQPITWGSPLTMIFNGGNSGPVDNVQARFTDISVWRGGPAGPCYLAPGYGAATPYPFIWFQFQDCWLRGVSWTVTPPSSTMFTTTITLTNNLFERAALYFVGVGQSPGPPSAPPISMTFSLQNNLFYGGSLSFYYDSAHYNWNFPTCPVYDNAFDNVALGEGGDLTSVIQNGNNGYINTPQLSGGNSNLVLTAFNYASGPLGNYYQQSTNFINQGNCTAAQVGLYHYTTRTNQAIEGNSIVDIGYHYVAVGTNGNPIDTDDDVIPDYLEDANGNGVYDAGDPSNWLDYYNGALPVLNIVSGNNQNGPLNAFLPLALTVQAASATGLALINAPLTFSVTNGLNQLAVSTNGTLSTNLSLRTDANGHASVCLFLPTNAPVTNLVFVMAQSGTNTVQVTFTCTEGCVATPVISPARGPFATVQSVAISCATTGAVIHYTTDGNNPTEADLTVTNGQSISVPWTMTIKAEAFEDGILLPSQVQTANFTITGAIAAGRKHTLALKTDGTMLAGGSGGNGQIGDGTTHLRTNLVSVVGVSNVVGIAAGELFSYAWESNGTAWALAWGDDREGETGKGTTTHQQTNAIPITNLTAVIGMSAGNHHGLAVDTNGLVWAWGYNNYGQLGTNNWYSRLNPMPVANFAGVVAVAAGSYHSLAIKTNGTVWGWGRARQGELGDGTTPPLRTIPVQAQGLTNVTAIAAGKDFSIAISNGVVWLWGTIEQPYPDNNPLFQFSTPTEVTFGPGGPPLTNIVAIAAGWYHILALKSDGTVWAWGNNDAHQLGQYDGSELGAYGPGTTVQQEINGQVIGGRVIGLSNIVAIAAGGEHSVALKSDGTIILWGYINYGQELRISRQPITPEPNVRLIGVPPIIMTQPTSLTVPQGANAAFSVMATGGTAPLSYQWYFNGTNAPLGGATNATLTLTNVYPANAGNYYVVVSDGLGSLSSSSATLTVNLPLTILTQPPNPMVGDNVTLSLTNGSPALVSYQWKYDGTNLSGATNSSLSLTNVKAADSGDYSVVAADIEGASAAATTTVNVLPYVILSSDHLYDNFTFQGDRTYYIRENIYLTGTTTFEGGTVIKFNNGLGYLPMYIEGAVQCEATPYRMAIFTDKNDDTVGEIISESTGRPQSGMYYSPYIIDDYGNGLVFRNMRFLYAGMVISGGGPLTFLDCQFLYSSATAIDNDSGPTVLRNVLFSHCGSVANIYEQMLTGEHLTVDQSGGICTLDGHAYLTNCLLTAVGSCPGNVTMQNCVSLPSGDGVYQTVGGGNYYLSDSDPHNCRNQGTTDIDPDLLAELGTKTTYPPLIVSDELTSATTWSSRAIRDTDTPDLGYHYDTLDYIISNVTLSATLTLTNGVAVGILSPSNCAVTPLTGGKLVSVGLPQTMNEIVSYQNVQEQGLYAPESDFIALNSGTDASRSFQFRFTDFSVGQGTTKYLCEFSSGIPYQAITFQDCQLRDSSLSLVNTINSGSTTTVSLINNLIIRCNVTVISVYNIWTLNCYNNLFQGGSFTILENGSVVWNIKDNLFDGATQHAVYVNLPSNTSPFSISNNGFTDGTANSLGGSNNKTNLTGDYQPGPLGNYYYPNSGTNLFQLVDAGSRSAADAGLYHYTTQTNQVKEANSVVDIGFHYVAGYVGWDGTFWPYDTYPDGIPDYLADANGNGICDPGEVCWDSLAILTQPVSQTVTAGNDATFQVVAWGDDVGYRWFFDDGRGQGPQTVSYYYSSSTLYLKNVQSTNIGTYTVLVNDAGCDGENCRKIMSDPAFLTVVPALPAPTPGGILAWWRGEKNGEDTIGGHTATLEGGVNYSHGKVGQAFYFDGNDDDLLIPYSSGLASSSFTFEAWIYPSNVWYSEPIMEQYDSGSNTRFTISLVYSDSVLSLAVTWNDGTDPYIVSSLPGFVRVGTFQHVAVTYDASASGDRLRVFLNGQPVASGMAGVNMQLKGSSDLYFGYGSLSTLNHNYFAGRMDEITLYNRALASSEILAIYNAGTAGKTPSCVSAPDGSVSWWEGAGNGADVYALNPATVEGAVTFTPGWVGKAFTFNGAAGQVRVPASDSLNVGASDDGFTVEAWINPSNVVTAQPVLEWNTGDFTGVALWLSSSGWLFANIRDTGLADNLVSGGQMAAGIYQHVALTYDKPNLTAHLFLNGVEIGQQTCSILLPPLTTGDLYIGSSPADDEGMTGTRFTGQIDEIGLYSRPLAASEIQNLYLAGGGGKCGIAPVIVTWPASQNAHFGDNVVMEVVATGTSLTYQWYINFGMGWWELGATGPTLSVTYSQNSDAYFYVRVANAQGSVDTQASPAHLTVTGVPNGTPPTISDQPQSQTICGNGGINLSVNATGVGTLRYQWCKNGINIAGATSYSYALTEASSADSGTYTVIVYDSQGHVTSDNAVVTVQPYLTAVVSGDTSINAGGTASIWAVLNGTGPWNVTWSDGITQNGVTQNPLVRNVTPTVTTAYTVTALSDANCTARSQDLSGSATVVVNGGLPYRVLSGSLTDYTFQGGTTYYISGLVRLHGTTTFEGGAVLKYAPDASLELAPFPAPQLKWLATPYRPVIFTSRDDNSVGATINDSTGNPDTERFANPALKIFNITATLANFRIAHAQQALVVYGCNATIAHAQFVKCQEGICAQSGTLALKNVLFTELETCLNRLDGVAVGAQFVTFADSTRLESGDIDGGENDVFVGITNSILANLDYVFTSDDVFGGYRNGFYGIPESQRFGDSQLSTGDDPFQSVDAGAGNYYLTDGCAFVNQGAGNIDPDLQAALTNRTTQPPLIVSGSLAETTWSPRAIRDTDTPDLGYHYDSLDYLIGDVNLSATLTLSDGVAVGILSPASCAITPLTGAKIVSMGLPQRMNEIVSYQNVQEQALCASESGFIALNSGTDASRSFQFRFTDFSVGQGGTKNLFVCNSGIPYQAITFQDCQLRDSYLSVGNVSDSGNTTTISLINNRILQCNVTVASINNIWTVNCYNNLFQGGSFTIVENGSVVWNIKDNLFDGATQHAIYMNPPSPFSISNNGFTAGTVNSLGGSNNKTDLVADYQTGPLGDYYYPTKGASTSLTNLINAGSRSAADAGLYHYTTQTNQVKERCTQVDIGFHYVAVYVDENGYISPDDTYPDGIPDYLADANGNGVCDPGETDWGGVTILTQPVSQTVTVGNDAVFQVSAVGYGDLEYLWYFQGNGISDAPTLYLQNVQNANAGAYWVLVDNGWHDIWEGYDSLFSSPAVLTVVPAVQVPEPNGIVAWWRGEGDGQDALGLNPAVDDNVNYSPGKVGKGFFYDGSSTEVHVPASSTLDSSSWDGFTFEAWVNPNDVSVSEPIMEQYDSVSGTRFTVSLSQSGSLDVTWVGGGGTHILSSAAGLVQSGTFQHVAVTYNAKATGDRLCLFLNGELVASGLPGINVQLKGSSDLYFGFSPSGSVDQQYFSGGLDEMTLYNRALASSEILAIYNASIAGKIPPCTAAPDDQISWWEGEGNSDDVYALNPATVEGDVTFTNGLVGKAFTFNGNTGQVRVPASDSMNVGIGDEFTVEAWVNPSNFKTNQPILEWNTGDFTGVALWISSSGLLYANIRDTDLADNLLHGGQGQLTTGVFQHVALTYKVSKTQDSTNWEARLYLNGVEVSSYSDYFWMPPLTACDFFIGYSPVDDEKSTDIPVTGTNFVGQIDEVGIYSRALQQSEIMKIYLANSGGKCGLDPDPEIITPPAAQTANVGNNVVFEVVAKGTVLTYQWYVDAGSGPQKISSATNRILTLMNVQTSQAGNYTVHVTHALNTVTSDPALLTVNTVANGTPPTITTQPLGQKICNGDGLALTVAANGSGTLRYQWCKNGININGATGFSYTRAAISSADSGTYTVVVYDAQGHVTSDSAVVAVNPHPTAVLTGDASINPGLMTPLMVVLTGTEPWTLIWTETEVESGNEKTYTQSDITNNPYVRWVAPVVSTKYEVTAMSDANCSARSEDLKGSATVDVSGASYYVPMRAGVFELSGDYTDFTFGCDMTYYITGPVNLYGKTTIEGGSVVKFASISAAPTARIVIHDPDIVCDTGPYRPAIFAGDDDVDFGYWGVEENWEPTGYYGHGLSLAFTTAPTVTLKNLKFLHLDSGISFDGAGTYNLYNCQFINCDTAVGQTANANVNLYNILFSDDASVYAPSGAANAPSLCFQNITADNCAKFASTIPAGAAWTGANSLLVAIPDAASIPTFVNVGSTCKIITDSTGVFQTGSDGSHYLADDTYRGIGTLSVDATLLAELSQRTTHPPMTIVPWQYFSGSWTFSPQVPRYVSGTKPDLGYYYDALDYTFGGVIALENAQITVLPGTVIGMRFDWWFGFDLWEGSSFVSQGTPIKPNTFVPVSLVQEGPFPYFWYPGWIVSFIPDDWPWEDYNPNDLPPPYMNFRFSNFYLNSGLSFHLMSGMDIPFLSPFLDCATICSGMQLDMQDCNLHSGWMNVGEPCIYYFLPVDFGGVVIPSSVSWKNNLFDRIDISLDPDLGATYWGWYPDYVRWALGKDPSVTVDSSLVATNNLFRGGWLFLEPPTAASAGNWAFENNLFDQVAFAQDPRQPLNYDYNAYWTNGLVLATGQNGKLLVTDTKSSYIDGVHDIDLVVAGAPPYETGPLGNFYVQNTTPPYTLYGAGHGLPGDVGLFHYTTRIDQTKEGNEAAGHNVNIGLHYVAATNSTSIQPYDYDADGIPDYVENWHGDGRYDLHTDTETDWQNDKSDGVNPDAYNAVYDDVDLDGDGLVGRIEKALGTNPLVPDNPLILTQVITGQEPQYATFRLPIAYNLLTTIGSLHLLMDGGIGGEFQECDPAPDGNCLLKWNTAFDLPGLHYLQPQFILNGQISSGNTPPTTVLTGVGELGSYYSSNVCQFKPVYSAFNDNGAILYAALPTCPDANYTIELQTASGTHIKTFANTTHNGEIFENWNLKDEHGNIVTDNTVKAVFNVTLLDPGDGSLEFWFHRAIYGWEGDFNVAYAWHIPAQARPNGEMWKTIQFSVVDTLLSPMMSRGGNWTPYLSSFNRYSDQDFPGQVGIPGYLETTVSAKEFVSDYLNGPDAMNFYFDGHGSPEYIGTGEKGKKLLPPAMQIEIGATAICGALRNEFNAGGDWAQHPYRFVFLNACETAVNSDFAHAFGIPEKVTSEDLSHGALPQAFLGWNGDSSAPESDDDWKEMANTYEVFFGAWMNGSPLADCLKFAREKNPYGDGSVIITRPLGMYSFHWTLHGGNFINNFFVKPRIYGYPGLTRDNYVPGYDGVWQK